MNRSDKKSDKLRKTIDKLVQQLSKDKAEVKKLADEFTALTLEEMKQNRR